MAFGMVYDGGLVYSIDTYHDAPNTVEKKRSNKYWQMSTTAGTKGNSSYSNLVPK